MSPDFQGFQSARISVQFPLGGCPMICIPAIPRSYIVCKCISFLATVNSSWPAWRYGNDCTQPPSLLANMIFGRDQLSIVCSCSLVYTADVSLFLHLQTTVFLTFLCVAHVAREEAKNGGWGGGGGVSCFICCCSSQSLPWNKDGRDQKTNRTRALLY